MKFTLILTLLLLTPLGAMANDSSPTISLYLKKGDNIDADYVTALFEAGLGDIAQADGMRRFQNALDKKLSAQAAEIGSALVEGLGNRGVHETPLRDSIQRLIEKIETDMKSAPLTIVDDIALNSPHLNAPVWQQSLRGPLREQLACRQFSETLNRWKNRAETADYISETVGESEALTAYQRGLLPQAATLYSQVAAQALRQGDRDNSYRLFATAIAIRSKMTANHYSEPSQQRLWDKEIQDQLIRVASTFPEKSESPDFYRRAIQIANARLSRGEMTLNDYLPIRYLYEELFPTAGDAEQFKLRTILLLLSNDYANEALIRLGQLPENVTIPKEVIQIASVALLTLLDDSPSAMLNNSGMNHSTAIVQSIQKFVHRAEQQLPTSQDDEALSQLKGITVHRLGDQAGAFEILSPIFRNNPNDRLLVRVLASIVSTFDYPEERIYSLKLWNHLLALELPDSPNWWEAQYQILVQLKRSSQFTEMEQKRDLLRLTRPDLGGSPFREWIEKL